MGEIRAYDAIVLAGGGSHRFGGVDKTRLTVGGVALLDRVLEACAGAEDTVVVGPARPTYRPVVWTVEHPPAGGPVPGIAAGLGLGEAELVAVLAADQPFLTSDAIDQLVASVGDTDGAHFVDDGRDQYLTGVYRRRSLRASVDRHAAEAHGLRGLPVRRLLAGLDLVRVPDPDGAARDCDTWDRLHDARRQAREDDGKGQEAQDHD